MLNTKLTNTPWSMAVMDKPGYRIAVLSAGIPRSDIQ